MSANQRRIGNVIVTKTLVLGTSRVMYSAWEPGAPEAHFIYTSSIDTSPALRMGRIDTAFTPSEFERLPSRTEARRRAVGLWEDAAKKRALAYVYAAHPELVDTPHSVDGGQVVLEGEHI